MLLVGMGCSLLAGFLGDETQTPPGEIIFEDDFEDPDSGWEAEEFPAGRVEYKGGAYAVVSNGEGSTIWGAANQSLSDVIVDVEATQVLAPPNDKNDYGVICRLRGNQRGYFLLVSGDGLFSILKADRDGYLPLVEWTPSGSIRQGNATNQIRADCTGNQIALYANGNLLASVQDSDYAEGDVALTATSYEDSPTEIHFDNLRLIQP